MQVLQKETRGLFYCPWNPKDTLWSYGEISEPYLNKKEMFMPIAAMMIAGAFEIYGWKMSIFDPNAEGREPTDRELLEVDYVLLGGITAQKEFIEGMANRCKRLGVPTIGGGPHLTSVGGLDIITHNLLGEGELTIPKFIADWKKRSMKHVYDEPEKGKNGYPTETVRPDLFFTPAYHLLPHPNWYFYATMQLGRGCPFRCKWCGACVKEGYKPRALSCEQVIAQLEGLKKIKFKGGVFVVDNDVFAHRSQSGRQWNAIGEWQRKNGWPFHFCGQSDVKVPDWLLSLAAKGGFNRAILGFETPSPEALKASEKKQNIGTNMVAQAKRFASHGMKVGGTFIFLDVDKPTIFPEMVTFMDDLGVPEANVSVVFAEEGTPYRKEKEAEGRLIPNSSGAGMNRFFTNLQPYHMKPEELVEGAAWANAVAFKPVNYYRRIWRLIEMVDLTKSPSGFKPWMVKRLFPGFVRSFKIANTDRGQYYFALLGRTLREKRKAMSYVAFYAISGEQMILSARRESGITYWPQKSKGEYRKESLRAFWSELRGKEIPLELNLIL